MKIVAAKCPNCGGVLEVDIEKDAAICKYCNTPFIVEKAIENYNITNNYTTVNNTTINAENINILLGDFDNFKKLAFEAWNGQDYESAYNYFSKATELRVEDIECRLYKALAFGWLSKFNNINVSFVSSTFKSVMIDNIFNDSNQIISYLIKFNNVIVAVQNMSMKNYNENYSKSLLDTINSNLRICCNAYEILLCIYEKYKLNESASKEYLLVLKNYAQCIAQLVAKKTCKLRQTGDAIMDYRSFIIPDAAKFEKVLNNTEKKIKSLDSEYEGAKRKVGGCYIATCVYGSYDCPEVWVLRRYRDYTLDTTWYGRLFIKIYYKLSPQLVKSCGEKKWFQRYWKKRLDKKIAKLRKKGIADTQYSDKY